MFLQRNHTIYGGIAVFFYDLGYLLDIILDIGTGMLGVIMDLCAGVVVADDAVVGDAESHHADGALLTETHAMAIAVAGEGDAVGDTVVEDIKESGLQLEVVADAGEGDIADAHLARRLGEGEQLAAEAVVLDIDFMFRGEIREPLVLGEHLDPFALPHTVGEGVGD